MLDLDILKFLSWNFVESKMIMCPLKNLKCEFMVKNSRNQLKVLLSIFCSSYPNVPSYIIPK